MWCPSSPVTIPLQLHSSRVLTHFEGGGVALMLIAKTFMSLFIVCSLKDREKERAREAIFPLNPCVGGLWEGGHCVVWLFHFHVMVLFNIYRLLLPRGTSTLTSFLEHPHRMMEPSLNCVFLVVFAAAQICELMLAHQDCQLHWWVLHHWYKLYIKKIFKRKVFIIGLLIKKKGFKKFSPNWSVFVRPTFGQSMHTSLVVPNEAI